MKSEKLLEAMGELPEEMVAEVGVRRRSPLVRIAAVAACFAVLLVSMAPFLKSFQGMGSDGNVSLEGVTFQGAFYEIVSTDYFTAQKRLDLPKKITSAIIGEQYDTLPDYGTVYHYAPLYGETGTGPAALYLLERSDEGHAGEWWYLVFCGFAAPTEFVEPDTLMAVYGIDEAADIAKVADVKTGASFVEPEVFYRSLPMFAPGTCGWEGFHQLVYGDAETEEEWLAIDEALHADYVQLRMETTAGLVAYMNYYPMVGYLSWSENYYPVGNLPG